MGGRETSPPKIDNQRGRATWSLTFALTVLALLVTLVLVTQEKPRPAPLREPGESLAPALAALPLEELGGAPAVEATPTAGGVASTRTGSTEYVVPWRGEAPAKETPWVPVPTPTRWPTPAPRPCVEYSFEWGDSPAVIGQILVEVRVRNRCGRKLEALEVLFRAEGIRGGDTIYSGQGNLIEPIYPDSVRTVMIALPGASTFYDSVTVVPVRPPVR